MTLDYIILEIECSWGKHPGWFQALSRDDKATLLAHRRVNLGA